MYRSLLAWLSGITDGFTFEKYILLYPIYAEPHEQRAVHCLAMRTNTLLRRIRMNTKKAMIEVNQSSLCVGVPGLEPGKTGPESVVLPITPYPKLSL